MTEHQPLIGISIPVPEPYGSRLQDERAGFGDAMARTVPSHVTLIPPMHHEDDVEGVARSLERTSATMSPFGMRLRGTGTFRPVSPVVFVAISEGISQTELLAMDIRRTLNVPEPEFPFHPHVTVAHHLDDARLDRAYEALSDFDCSFLVESFALYLHHEVEGWVPERKFLLGR
ncbi:2'-5' RNA ligase family protein [Aeromicrobium sp.]|uniref:2'-5' RNA ligase family protein n=1 Tax=Aeromicrobium sp. TaxID=1871063 RepID=UPI003C44BF6B